MKASSNLNYRSTYEWTNAVLSSLRASVENLGFIEIVPSILSGAFEPGAKHSLAVLGDADLPIVERKAQSGMKSDTIIVNGKEVYYLPVSHVVEKQKSLTYVDKVYCLTPCLRLLMAGEDASKKHLYNFFQFEIEWRTESLDEVFKIGENILVSTARLILDKISDLDIRLNDCMLRNLNSLISGNYPVITFARALELLGKDGSKEDLSQEDDLRLSLLFDTPFWITEYPEGVRDSIYHKNPKGFYDTYDLMLPFGFGELTTGGLRPRNSKEIIDQSLKLGKIYSPDYANWKDTYKVQTAGFGLGLERLLKFITNSETILDFVQFHDSGPNKKINKDFFIDKSSVEDKLACEC